MENPNAPAVKRKPKRTGDGDRPLTPTSLKQVAPALKVMTIMTSSMMADSSSGAFLRLPNVLRGHPGCGRWLMGITRTEHRRTDMRQHGRPLCRHSLGAGTERRDPTPSRGLTGWCHWSRQLYRQIYRPKKITKALSSGLFCGPHRPEGRRGTPAVVAGGGGSSLRSAP